MKVLFATLTKHDEPLGIMYLSSVLKNAGHIVRAAMLEREDIRSVIEEFKPDLIAYSAMGCEEREILKINSSLKEKYSFFSLIGGPLATFSPGVINNKDVDAICIGEGEKAVEELLAALRDKKDARQIKNIWIKDNGQIYKNSVRPPIENIDSLPFPDRLIFKRFKKDESLFKDFKISNAYYISTSRGCHFDCTYCYNRKYRKLYEGKGPVVRYRGVDNVIAELEQIINNFEVSMFWFQDDHFYSNLNILTEFADKYKAKINKPFKCALRPEFLTNEEVVKNLKKAGCGVVFTGCEAGNDEIRRKVLKRNLSKEQIIKACDLLNKYNINIALQNMLGIPTSTFEHDIETLELNIRCKPHYAWSSICTPYIGTEIYEIAEKAELLGPNYLNEMYNTYHYKSCLLLPWADKVNVLHKIFALVTEYPDLLPLVKQEEFYDNIDNQKVMDIFNSFKKYKYEQLYNPELRPPEVILDFINKVAVDSKDALAVKEEL